MGPMVFIATRSAALVREGTRERAGNFRPVPYSTSPTENEIADLAK